MMKQYWRPETGIFLILWLGLLVIGRSDFFRDPGTFWHTVAGERMLASGRLIDTDPFSFTHRGHTWIAQNWLAECGMALLYRLGGFDLLLLASATLLAGLYSWAAARWIWAGLHWSVAVVLLALVLAASSHHFHARPHLLTIAFLGIILAILIDYERGAITWRGLLWLLPLFVLWTNCHGGVLGGIGTVGLAATGWTLAWLLGKPSPLRSWRDWLGLALITAGVAGSALVSPFGWGMVEGWRAILVADLPSIIQEHAPLSPWDLKGASVLLLGLVYLFLLAGVIPRWPRITWMLPLVWLYLAVTRIRHGPLFAITAAIAMADLIPQTRWARWIAMKGSDLFRPPPEGTSGRTGWRPWLIPALVVTLASGLQVAGVHCPVIGRGWVRLDSKYWPVELLPELDAIELRTGRDVPIFHDLLYGGFLIFYTPHLPVFIDDRCELYGRELLPAYDEAEKHHPETLEKWADQYQIDYALVRKDSNWDRYLATSPRWKTQRTTQAATLYVRTRHP